MACKTQIIVTIIILCIAVASYTMINASIYEDLNLSLFRLILSLVWRNKIVILAYDDLIFACIDVHINDQNRFSSLLEAL
jgi:hypothetical protein